MDEIYKDFSIDFYNRLKSTVNAGIRCDINYDEDKLYIEFIRLGVNYKTSIENISSIIQEGENAIEIAFDKVVKRYRNFVNHKFFY